MFSAKYKYIPESDMWGWMISDQITDQTLASGFCLTAWGCRRKMTVWTKLHQDDPGGSHS